MASQGLSRKLSDTVPRALPVRSAARSRSKPLRAEETGSSQVKPPSVDREMAMLETTAESTAGPTVYSSTPIEMKPR